MKKLLISGFFLFSLINGFTQLKIKEPKGYIIKDSILAEEVRVAVMATGHFDHSDFHRPKWVTPQWSDKLWRNKEGERCRKRKALMVIVHPEGTDYYIVYFWLIQKQSKEDKKWYVFEADIIW